MGDMKDKVKGFMKKVNNPFSSPSLSGKFKGQGRVLGSSSSSSEPGAGGNSNSNSNYPRPSHNLLSNPRPNNNNNSITPSPQKKPISQDVNFNQNRNLGSNGFDPFDSLVTSGKRSQSGLYSFDCPICNQSFKTEDEVSVHVDTCVNNVNDDKGDVMKLVTEEYSISRSELEVAVGNFVSGKPSDGSVDVVLRLLRNIVKEPDNPKFRRIRMSNPKIREAVGEVVGGVELLECVGFELKEEGGEMWAVMEVPKEEQISSINKVILLLEKRDADSLPSASSTRKDESNEQVEPKKIDRQIRVFFSVPESVAAKIELPDSFYKLSLDEVKREANMRKKKIEESQLLIPKSFKEKQAKAARKRYTRTVIRTQFPDGVVLQGVFAPWEPTSALYEFVSSALKEPSLEFELLHPVVIKRRVIPHFPAPGERPKTLDEEDLVPSALIKFRPIETDSTVFTGLCNDLLQIIEPLGTNSAVGPS